MVLQDVLSKEKTPKIPSGICNRNFNEVSRITTLSNVDFYFYHVEVSMQIVIK
jgi:hypothetical protein